MFPRKMIDNLNKAIEKKDEEEVQNIIFSLSDTKNESGFIPDEISFGIIDILRNEEMKSSSLAGHILNFFEFHTEIISPKAKDRCVGFLNAWGNKFNHVHSTQVVTELTHGNYLR